MRLVFALALALVAGAAGLARTQQPPAPEAPQL